MKITFARTFVPVAPWIAEHVPVAIHRTVPKTHPIIRQLRVAQPSRVSRKPFRLGLWQPAIGT